jgi:hypothetical protein
MIYERIGAKSYLASQLTLLRPMNQRVPAVYVNSKIVAPFLGFFHNKVIE